MSLEVLILTGPCAVGKTSTAKEWAKVKKGAIVECDYLTNWIYNDAFPHWTEEEEKFTSKLSSKIADEYLNLGMSVVIENVWTPLGIDIIKDFLSNRKGLNIKCIRLMCNRSINHKRDQQRIVAHQMKERVDIVNDELDGYDWNEDTIIIDNSNLTISQVVSLINRS